MTFATFGASAQPDVAEDLNPNVLDVDNPSEPGCFSSSHLDSGVCMINRAKKADRWLEGVFAECLYSAQMRTEFAKENPIAGTRFDYVASLQRVHDAFERYRELASMNAYDANSPGLLSTFFQYSTYFELTVERAIALSRACCSPGQPRPKLVDLNPANWCT